MKWEPSATPNSRTADVDIDSVIQKTENTQGKMSHKFKSSSGTGCELEFMQTAELVFPELDNVATVSKEELKGLKNKMKRGKKFVDNYFDRKARAKFVRFSPSPYHSVPTEIMRIIRD